ncbi:CRISPR-associated RAMP protein, Cmr4 family [Chloroherpeton thalassium ATCC 35110]|uniref:CRISPR-associated RAMP protein, Cmr4 family n=1 Tax=Chloroherpeton thalassium (strain ATCC 35110 / GB-78) TaxID=517418 RepID=B3QXD5_CHLT3|nr:type III-B CRISPR module RAMP protein Cmr4 [Chloroherpeton thalassium]ACF13409.1 CRISPR-associated RAMP protein, Cmr4 family [Chloroherpeton thalassium ATCC 35110]
MFRKATPLFLICETPMHAGSGSDLGVIDLPIQRERHTSFPKIEGSSLKGAIRQAFEDKIGQEIKGVCTPENTVTVNIEQQSINLTFGPENAGNDGHAGALGFTDARLLLFPVKSMKGVFAWITCPKVLQQFYKDFSLAGITDLPKVQGLSKKTSTCCELFVSGKNIVLEEYTFSIDMDCECTKLSDWLSKHVTHDRFWKEKMKRDIVVLPDEDFTDFVNLSTEVITRTKISNETGTVEQGALFTEEYLPAESVMYSLALASPIFKENDDEKGIFNLKKMQNDECKKKKEEQLVMEFFKKGLPEVIQVGGNATLGKGLVRTKSL